MGEAEEAEVGWIQWCSRWGGRRKAVVLVYISKGKRCKSRSNQPTEDGEKTNEDRKQRPTALYEGWIEGNQCYGQR